MQLNYLGHKAIRKACKTATIIRETTKGKIHLMQMFLIILARSHTILKDEMFLQNTTVKLRIRTKIIHNIPST